MWSGYCAQWHRSMTPGSYSPLDVNTIERLSIFNYSTFSVPFFDFIISESVETARCFDSLWHVRLGGMAGGRPSMLSGPSPPQLDDLPRLSLQLVCRQSFVTRYMCWNRGLTGMKMERRCP